MKISTFRSLPTFSQVIRHRRLPRYFVRQLISLMLTITLVTNPLLAAPQGFTLLGHEMSYGASFWWHNSGWAAKTAKWFTQSKPSGVTGWDGKGAPPNTPPEPKEQEKQSERDVKVQSIEISPRDVVIQTGEKVIFSAIAYDKSGNMIPGVKYTWDGNDEGKNRRMSVTPRGEFSSPVAGKYKVTVEALGKKDSVKVDVVGDEVKPTQGVPGEPVSSQDQPKPAKIGLRSVPNTPKEAAPLRQNESDKLAKLTDKSTRAAATTAMVVVSANDQNQWNSTNYTTADDACMETGQMPGHAVDGGAGSGNFQFSAPIIGMDGRGIDLNLAMNYNSRLWHKSGTEMYFDIDNDYIPGWTFGFGKIITAGSGYMMIDANGTRHSYGGKTWNYPAPNSALQGFDGYTKDGTFINYWVKGYQPQFSGNLIQQAQAWLPNGTNIVYGAAAKLAAYPVQITDANGNYITITYVGNQGPNIATITDTLGRQIKFQYTLFNGGNVVTSITAPGYNGGADRVVVQYAYDTRSLTLAGVGTGTTYGFIGVTPRVANSQVTVMKAIYYPATKTGYWFGYGDSYSKYGMLRRISERRQMNCTNPNSTTTGQATFAAIGTDPNGSGVMSREMVYSHSALPGYSDLTGALTDVPTYNRMTEDWAGRQQATVPQPVTEYSVVMGATVVTRITRRDSATTDGLTTEQITDNASTSSTYGLLLEDKTFPNKTSTVPLRKSKVTWEVPAMGTTYTFPSNNGSPRPSRTEITDERNQMTATDYTYGTSFNQITEVREKGWNGLLLRRTHTDYINTTNYIGTWVSNGNSGSYVPGGRHILSLVSAVEVYGSDDTTRASRTEYQYDQQSGQALIDAPGVVQHWAASNPYDPLQQDCGLNYDYNCDCYLYSCGAYYNYYNYTTDARGNVTNVKRYADAANYWSDTNAIVETRSYDMAGNLRVASTSCCEQTSFNYTSGTAYTWPTSVTRGSASDPAQQNTSSTSYDFNTGLMNNTTDANSRSSSIVYNEVTLRPWFEWSPRGSYVLHLYNDDSMLAIDWVYELNQINENWANRVDKYLDGYGRVATEIGYTKVGTNYDMDVVDSVYDQFGRMQKQTRPYRRYANGTNAETPNWTNYTYDVQDRISTVVAPDGSTTCRYYNESAYPAVATAGAGNIIRVKDAWNRERWAKSDDQGRLVEVVEPNPTTGSLATGYKTNYEYNTLGNVTKVLQGVQERKFKYDSLGRLTNQKLAERDATLSDSGGTGTTWSDYFKYDNRGNLMQRIDARRVVTDLNYGSDPLNRLQSVSYNKTGALNAGNILDAATVTYKYDNTAGKDKTRLIGLELGVANNTTTDFGEQSFGYDFEGRLSSMTQSYGNNRSATTSYVFDTLDRVNQVNYPAQTGQSGAPIRQAVPTYDIASRLQQLTYNGTVMATNPVYNASSQTTSLNLGNTTQEQYTFDPQTGLLTNQKVVQGANTHVDLAYNYTLANTLNNVGAKTGQLAFIKDNKVTNGNRNRAYTYDKLGRLTQAQGGASLWSQTYAYDQYGNRTGVTKTGNSAGGGTIDSDGIAAMTYNAATNRITTSTDFTYDETGNQTKSNENSQIQTYRYDAAGRLAEVTTTAGVHTYGYGASNQRLQMIEAGAMGSTTLYAWEGGSVIAEYNGASNGMAWTKSYIYLGGRLLATESALSISTTETKYHHPERLGTRLVTSSAGAVVSENISLPFGATISGESLNLAGSATKKRFTSYDRSDTTKLDYAVNRHYSPAQGRFTQVDPIGMNATSLGNPQSLNLYAYCTNDPINQIDPSGLFGQPDSGGGGSNAGGIAGFIAAVIGALQLIFGGRAKTPTGLVGQVSQRFASNETGSGRPWKRASILAGVGAAATFLQSKKEQKKQADNQKTLDKSFERVLKRIAKKKTCKDLFGGLDVGDYLKKNTSNGTTLQNGQKFPDGIDASTSNVGPGNKKLDKVTTIFNSDASIFTGVTSDGHTLEDIFNKYSSAVKENLGYGSLNSVDDYVDLEVLHEVFHGADKKGEWNDTNDGAKSKEINDKIKKACF